MNNDPIFDFFHGFSRVLVFLVIGILVVGVIMKGEKTTQVASVKISKLQPTITINIQSNTEKKQVIDLKGPYVCSYKTKDVAVTAYIQNKDIKAVILTNKEQYDVLVKGDCLYYWGYNLKMKQTCGMSPYLGLIEQMPMSSLISNPFMMNMLKSKSPVTLSSTIDFQEIINSCKKEEIKNQKVFDLPN